MQNLNSNLNVTFPPKLAGLFKPNRYKILYGGRGGGKSVGIARALLLMGTQQNLRILCAREYQSSIADSVHQLLVDSIEALQLYEFYEVERDKIIGRNGTTFRFQGIRTHINQIKSFSHIDICWIEEAANVSRESWDVLIPTLRDGKTLKTSEIWVSFNPLFSTDDTYRRFVLDPPPGATVICINYWDNPWFPDVLRQEMEDLKARNHDDYLHVYEGQCRRYLEGAVYAKEIKEAEIDGRFTKVPYDPIAPVETFWDLGYGDKTAIWIAQRVGMEIHVIDYIEGRRNALDFYLKMLAERPYPIARYWMPHDARAKQLGTGLSIEEMMRSKGNKVSIVPKFNISDGINAVRSLFPQLFFDAKRCAQGLAALRNYRFEIRRDAYGGFSNEPLHDDNSHASDACRYMCTALRKPKPEVKPQQHGGFDRFYASNTTWMNV